MLDIHQLITDIQQEAEKETFPIDEAVYQAAGIKPTEPILYAGNLQSKLCIFGRDLGKDEVYARQPLYGAAGTLLRRGLYNVLYNETATKGQNLQVVLERVVLTNTVPYKPTGNKAYSEAVKQRFRPFIERFLLFHWQGDQIITLGNEAFHWFAPYTTTGSLKAFFTRSDRYAASIPINLQAIDSQGNIHKRWVTLLPLPHPSPLNQKYYAQFPQLLQNRLVEIFT